MRFEISTICFPGKRRQVLTGVTPNLYGQSLNRLVPLTRESELSGVRRANEMRCRINHDTVPHRYWYETHVCASGVCTRCCVTKSACVAPSARNRPAIDMSIIWPRSGAMLTRSCGIKTTQTMESGDCVKLGLDLEDALLRRKTVHRVQTASKGHFPQRKLYRCQGGVLITSKPLK